MAIQGTSLKDSNVRLRFFTIILIGVIAFAAVLYWRHQTLVSAEYVEFDIPHRKANATGTLSSPRYQIDVQETSPSIN
jgi:hypothetical protein